MPIVYKSRREIELMRRAGQVACQILAKMREAAVVGVTTLELDELEDLADLLDRPLQPLITPEYRWHLVYANAYGIDPPARFTTLARALDVDPDCSLALAVDGLVHTNLLRQLDVASDRYDHAIRANPSNALAWLLRAGAAEELEAGS